MDNANRNQKRFYPQLNNNMAYVFQTNLLSANKTGNPPLLVTSLTGIGVTFLSGARVPFLTQPVIVVSLSTNDLGIAFNPVSLSVATNLVSTFEVSLSAYPLVTVTVNGSVFLLPVFLDSTPFAVVNTNGNFTTVQWVSSFTSPPLSATATDRDVLTPEQRRKWLYGYI